MIVFEEEFMKSKGQPIKYKGYTLQMTDRFPLQKDKIASVRLVFEMTNSPWRQGVQLRVDQFFEINEKMIREDIVLWEDTAPKVVDFKCNSNRGELIVINVWDTGDGTMQFWHAGGAMKVECISDRKRRYFCNDGQLNDDMKDLIFTIECTMQ